MNQTLLCSQNGNKKWPRLSTQGRTCPLLFQQDTMHLIRRDQTLSSTQLDSARLSLTCLLYQTWRYRFCFQPNKIDTPISLIDHAPVSVDPDCCCSRSCSCSALALSKLMHIKSPLVGNTKASFESRDDDVSSRVIPRHSSLLVLGR